LAEWDEWFQRPLVTRSRLVEDLRRLGLCPGEVVMLHASVSAIGWVVGGPDMAIQALLDVLGPEGTLMMYVGWEDDPYKLTEWPEEWQKAYLEECPPFDPQRSRACRKWSILTEYLRTWPGAFRSDHPEASVAAVGAKAQWLAADHPLNYPFFGRVFHDDCQRIPGEREGPFG
jgi:aminoglycoside 3-N-acetyltransferase